MKCVLAAVTGLHGGRAVAGVLRIDSGVVIGVRRADGSVGLRTLWAGFVVPRARFAALFLWFLAQVAAVAFSHRNTLLISVSGSGRAPIIEVLDS